MTPGTGEPFAVWRQIDVEGPGAVGAPEEAGATEAGEPAAPPAIRAALTLKVAGYSYREIQQLLGVSYTWVNRQITEGRAKLRERAHEAEKAVEEACRYEGTSHPAGARQGMCSANRLESAER